MILSKNASRVFDEIMLPNLVKQVHEDYLTQWTIKAKFFYTIGYGCKNIEEMEVQMKKYFNRMITDSSIEDYIKYGSCIREMEENCNPETFTKSIDDLIQ